MSTNNVSLSPDQIRGGRFKIALFLSLNATALFVVALLKDYEYFVPAAMLMISSIISWVSYSKSCQPDFTSKENNQ
jgi:hypothetical protein